MYAVLMRLRKSLTKLAPPPPRGNRRPFECIPGPKPLPLLGNVWRYLPLIGDYKPDTLYENACLNRKLYGTIVREKITNSLTILHLFNPSDIEAFFRQDGKYPHRRSHRALLKYRLDRPESYSDGGLFPENGPNWYRQRNQFQQRLMLKSQVARRVPKLDKISAATVERLAQSSKDRAFIVPAFDKVLQRWALASTLQVFLDCDIDELGPQNLQELTDQIHHSLIGIDGTELKSDRWITRPNRCKYYQSLSRSQDFLFEFVTSKVDEALAAKGNSNSNSASISYVCDWIIEDKLSKKDVVCFIIDALMAGLHTTSYTMAFNLYHLSRNKQAQDELRTAVNQTLTPDKRIGLVDLEKITILRDCVKETMRLNPVSIGTGRVVTQDNVVLSGYHIPRGTMTIAQTQVSSRDEKTFSNPHRFKPERWSSYRGCPYSKKPSPFASLPFGFGPRACIGQRIAELQMKLLTARIVQTFEIEHVDELQTQTTLIHQLSESFSVTLNKIN